MRLFPALLFAATSTFALWENPAELDGEWKRIDWFGWIHEAGHGWLYSPEHGWGYTYGQSEDSLWFYDRDTGWAWTGKDVYPYYFVSSSGDWLRFESGNRDLRIFRLAASGDPVIVYRNDPFTPSLSPGTYQWRHEEYTATEENVLISSNGNVTTTELEIQVIENDLIRVTLLPGWGARILSIYYKPQKMELLSYAKGEKYSRIIKASGAFYYDDWLLLPGGINPTFPEGEHGKYWGEPWIFQSIDETATSVTVRMSRTDDIDWSGTPEKFNNGLTGMTVDMDITVHHGRAGVEITYALTNNKNETIPYEFWMAASLAPLPPDQTVTSSNLEIIMDQEKIILRDWWNWMRWVETNDETRSDDIFLFDKLAWLYNWQGSGIAYAWPETDNGWWGVINHDYNWGVLRTIDDPADSPGMKIWGEGSDYGMFELWSGNSQEFFVDAFLSPLEVKTWKEYFIPTVDLSGITFANQHGAAQAEVIIGSLTGYVDMSVFSTWQPANWRLQILAIPVSGDPVRLGDAAINFSTGAPTQSVLLPFPMDSLPAGEFRIEAGIIDLFTGEQRMRFDIGD